MAVYHFPPRGRNRLGAVRRMDAPSDLGTPADVLRRDTAEAFDVLTTRLVMAQTSAGTLNPGVVEALLLGCGLAR
jgi:hypothetical protein